MIKQFLTGICVVFLFACNNGAAPVPPVATGKFNFSVLRYDSTALEYRLDSLHNRGLVLQSLTREAGNNNTAFQLISYAFDTLNDYNNSWMPDTLAVLQDSLPKNFGGRMIIGNNEVTREQLLSVVRDKDGKRFSYDYILFSPVIEGVFFHLVYQMKTYKNGKPTPEGIQQISSPMPPIRNW